MSGLQERFALLTVPSPPNMVSANLDKVANLVKVESTTFGLVPQSAYQTVPEAHPAPSGSLPVGHHCQDPHDGEHGDQ
jgi:hypothetical protein